MRDHSLSEGRLPAALFCLLALLIALPGVAAEQTLVRFVTWKHHEDDRLSGSSDLLARFHETHPALRVNLSSEPWSQAALRLKYWFGSYRQYAPELTTLPDCWLADYADRLLPLDDVLRPGDLAPFVPAMLDRCRVRGKLLGIPWIVNSKLLYVRADLLEAARRKPPRTLQELAETARALASPPERYGLGLPGGSSGVELFFWLLASQGGRAADEQGKLRLTTPEAAAALEYWGGLQRAGALQPEVTTWTTADLEDAFLEGKLAMVIAGPEFTQRLREAQTPLKIEMLALPAGKAAVAAVSARVLVVLKDSPHSREALPFVTFMTSAEAQKAMSFMGSLPTHRAYLEQMRGDRELAPLMANLERAQGLPMDQPVSAVAIAERALWLYLTGRMAADQALATATREESASIF